MSPSDLPKLNYEQPPRTSQNSDFQSNFSVWKIEGIPQFFSFFEEYCTRRPILIFEILYFLKMLKVSKSEMQKK
jgi:hypothetical protein